MAAPIATDAAPAVTMLVFREPHKGETFHYVDVPPKSKRLEVISAGDELIFTNPIALESKIVGKIHVICTATQRASAGNVALKAGFICDILAKVPGGTLAMVSPLAERGNPNGRKGAVVGGTGRYAGARGTFDDEEGRTFDTNTITLSPGWSS